MCIVMLLTSNSVTRLWSSMLVGLIQLCARTNSSGYLVSINFSCFKLSVSCFNAVIGLSISQSSVTRLLLIFFPSSTVGCNPLYTMFCIELFKLFTFCLNLLRFHGLELFRHGIPIWSFKPKHFLPSFSRTERLFETIIFLDKFRNVRKMIFLMQFRRLPSYVSLY